MTDTFEIHPLTQERWADLVDLFGPERGANSGCWCMWPRIARADYKAMDKTDKKAGFQAIVNAGPPPGLIAYGDGKAVGWCAVGPRPTVARFHGAKASRPLEDADGLDATRVFAITCFFIRTGYRRRGLTKLLAKAAIDFAKQNKAVALDVCAVDADKPLMWGDGFVGISSVFEKLGFSEIARRSPRRPLMRLALRTT